MCNYNSICKCNYSVIQYRHFSGIFIVIIVDIYPGMRYTGFEDIWYFFGGFDMTKKKQNSRVDIYVPEWAREEVDRFMSAQSNRGQSFAVVILDAIEKYGYTDCVAAKLSSNLNDKK